MATFRAVRIDGAAYVFDPEGPAPIAALSRPRFGWKQPTVIVI